MSSKLTGSVKQSVKNEEDHDDQESGPYSKLADDEIEQLIEKFERDKEVIITENNLLLNFLENKDSDCLKEVHLKLDRLPKSTTDMTLSLTRLLTFDQRSSKYGVHSVFSNRSKNFLSQRSRFGSTRTISSTNGQHIADRMKIDIAERELDNLKRITNKKEKDATKQLAELKNETQELQTTVTELLERMDQFDHDVMVTGIDPITNRVPAEMFTKFLETEIKNDTKLVAKLRLRSSSMKQHLVTIKKQLAQKEQMSSILRPIDYEQMKIEKTRLTDELSRKNKAFYGIRQVNGKISLACSKHKKILDKKIGTIKNCEHKVSHMQLINDRLLSERKLIELELNNLDDKITDITNKTKQYKAPSVDEYLDQQKKLNEMKHRQKALAREVDLHSTKYLNLKRRQMLKPKRV